MSGPQTTTPVRPQAPAQDPKKNPFAYVLTRWIDFDTKAKAGTLGADQAKSIRAIITQQPRAAILQGFISLKFNIFKDMSPILDPRLSHDGALPALTIEQYNREHSLALEDLKTLSMRSRLAQKQAGSGNNASGSQKGSSPVGTPQPQVNSTVGSPNPPATASPRPNNPNATAPQAAGRPPIRPGPPPSTGGMMPLPDVRKILAMGNSEQREEVFAKNPGLKQRFNAAVSHFQNTQARNLANANGNVRPPNPNPNTKGVTSAPSSGPSTPNSSQNAGPSNSQTQPQQQSNQAQAQNQVQTQSNPVRPTGPSQTPARPPIAPNQAQINNPNPHGGTPTPNPNPTGAVGMSNRPFNLNQPPQRQGPPVPPPIPIEAESTRRKRKFRQYVKEEAPGLEVEVGVDQIVSDYLDAFIDEAARGAIRLAKHRKGSKVELKDMALFLDVTHDVRLPGFNVQLPQRQHTSGENERKKGKAVAPRAVRRGKDAE